MTTQVARITIAADHPALPGHFPGQPVVPGVLLLDAVMRAAMALDESRPAPSLVPRVKFMSPVEPGAVVEITLSPRGADRLGFTCRCGDALALSGEMRWPTQLDSLT